jgi:hypothetical protein
MNADKLAQAIERTARHRAATDGIDPDQWRVVLYKWEAEALAEYDAQPAQAAQPVGVADGWREFITRVANQGPSKPDYWSTCAQCERNTSDAEDLLTAAPPPPAQPSADAEDAARYRWLTNHCFDESLFNESEDKCEVDSRIDAARAAEGRS